jgi:hypothetical protein
VGIARTLLIRAGQAESLRHFLIDGYGGAGTTHGDSTTLSGSDLFVILAKPDSNSDAVHLQKQMNIYFKPVSFEWHNESAGLDLMCPAKPVIQYPPIPHDAYAVFNGHHANQLRQWAQCMDSIEKHELLTTSSAVHSLKQDGEERKPTKEQLLRAVFRYDVVIKARPDDLWYGPILPWCSFRRDVAYVSQQVRWPRPSL